MNILDRTVELHYSFNFIMLVLACADTCLFYLLKGAHDILSYFGHLQNDL